jgi:hypothetical protein
MLIKLNLTQEPKQSHSEKEARAVLRAVRIKSSSTLPSPSDWNPRNAKVDPLDPKTRPTQSKASRRTKKWRRNSSEPKLRDLRHLKLKISAVAFDVNSPTTNAKYLRTKPTWKRPWIPSEMFSRMSACKTKPTS